MASLSGQFIERLTEPGARLSWLTDWLLHDVWSTSAYTELGPLEYLNRGELAVNSAEEVIAAAAGRVYDELLTPPPPERDLKVFLREQQPCAVVVFDGLSLREMPLLMSLAEKARLEVKETGASLSAVPSETIDFLGQRLASNISPSQLAQRRDLGGIALAAYYYGDPMQQHRLDENCDCLLLWSAFPDNTYSDSGARFPNHFENMHQALETAWKNTVMMVPSGRRILVTSDHGYVYFGSGMSFARSNPEVRPLTDFLGGERYRRLAGTAQAPRNPDLKVLPDRQLAVVQGRVQTHPPGPASARLYKHGGLSLMEMLTPWIVLEGPA